MESWKHFRLLKVRCIEVARVTIDEAYLTNIADAIRKKAKSEEKMKVTDMAEAIKGLKNGSDINLLHCESISFCASDEYVEIEKLNS